MTDYYDRDGTRMADVREWAAKAEAGEKRVAEDSVGDYWISTVWLGLDHSFGSGPPLIFETMIFPRKDGKVADWGELYCERYSTEEQAQAGHERIVQAVKDGILPEKGGSTR